MIYISKATHCKACLNPLSACDTYWVSNTYQAAFCCWECLWEYQSRADRLIKAEKEGRTGEAEI